MEKRTDNKGRILRNGESQRKDGRYAYKYIENGKPKFVYSWKLVSTDRVPKGKRDCVSLREKVKMIEKDVNVNINFTKNVSLSFTSFGCFAHLPLSLISCLLFYRTFL